MSDKLYQLFNNKLTEFIKELIKTFPSDPDFKLFQTSIRVLLLADEKKPLQFFNKGLTDEYKENIRTQNEKFFLDHDYQDVLNNDEVKADNINNKLVNKLKGYWKDLDEDNRKIVWEYFGIFLKIVDKLNS